MNSNASRNRDPSSERTRLDEDIDIAALHTAARWRAIHVEPHEVIEDDHVNVIGVPCDTEWCTAFTDATRRCGDDSGPYVLSHRNRVERAPAADAADWACEADED